MITLRVIYGLAAVVVVVTSSNIFRQNFPVIENLRFLEQKVGSTLEECIPIIRVPRNCDEFKFKRSLNGTCNNLIYRDFGAARTPLVRPLGARYFDDRGLDLPAGFPTLQNFFQFPTPQEITETVFKSAVVDGNNGRQSLLFMVMGQFIDHDMSITEYSEERFSPTCDNPKSLVTDFRFPRFPIFNSRKPGAGCRRFSRSFAVCQRSSFRRIRQQANSITSFIDASNVYGSSEEELEELREENGFLLRVEKVQIDGKTQDLLPFVKQEQCIDGICFLAGDERSSEHVGLSTMHTIFVREHNRIAIELKELHPDWSDEEIFEVTRRIVGGIMQKIVFEEFLPNLVELPTYRGYNPYVNPGIISAFSTAAFRFGHSLIKNAWTRLDKNYDPIPSLPDLPLAETFLNTRDIRRHGIEPFVFGYLRNNSNIFDREFADGVFNRLFSNPLDPTIAFIKENLLARNIHRGRDHGLQGYLAWRRAVGLRGTLEDIPFDLQRQLLQLYGGRAENIDMFAGGILEKRRFNSLVGPLFKSLIKIQFRKLRDGDRFYFRNEKQYSLAEIREFSRSSISRVLCDNVIGMASIQRYPFLQVQDGEKRISCENTRVIPRLNLSVFRRLTGRY